MVVGSARMSSCAFGTGAAVAVPATRLVGLALDPAGSPGVCGSLIYRHEPHGAPPLPQAGTLTLTVLGTMRQT